MNRRDFLRAAPGVARSAGQVLAALDEVSQLVSSPCADPDLALLRMARRAMATTFEVLVPYGTPDALALGEAALDRIDELEAQLTVYRDSSEVSRLNRMAAYQAIPVEDGLFGLLELAARINRDTDGAFDVTTGALSKAWGFYRGPRRVPSEEELAEALQHVGMRHVELDSGRHTVRYRRRGLEINLGSIGKGHALDRVAEMLDGEETPAYLLHGGRSSVYARGSPPGEDRGWQISISHPWNTEQPIARLWLKDRGLGTSAATFQHLEHQGRKLGHVLDPRTGWPAGGVASATVIAPTSAEADALSTAFFILGSEAARLYCEGHPDIGAIVLPEGAAAAVAFGLSETETSFSLM